MAQKATSTMAVGGRGLLLAPLAPWSASHLKNGNLLVGRQGPPIHPVAMVVPGAAPGEGVDPVLDEALPLRTFRFGRGGPLISLGNGAKTLDQIFALALSTGVDEPWTVLTQGFLVDLPAGFVAYPPSPDQPGSSLEFHASEGAGLLQFQRRPAPVTMLKLTGGPEFAIVDDGAIECETGAGSWWEFRYSHEGRPWRARWYGLPLGPEASLVLRANAPDEEAQVFFSGSHRVAKSMALAGV